MCKNNLFFCCPATACSYAINVKISFSSKYSRIFNEFQSEKWKNVQSKKLNQERKIKSIIKSINQSINQPINQSINQPITNQSTNHQSINQSPINRSIDQSINQSISRIINQSINQLMSRAISPIATHKKVRKWSGVPGIKFYCRKKQANREWLLMRDDLPVMWIFSAAETADSPWAPGPA